MSLINKNTPVYYSPCYLGVCVCTLQEFINENGEGVVKMDNEGYCTEFGDDGYTAPISIEQAIWYVEHTNDFVAFSCKQEFFESWRVVRDSDNCEEEEYLALVAETNEKELDVLYSRKL